MLNLVQHLAATVVMLNLVHHPLHLAVTDVMLNLAQHPLHHRSIC